MKRNLPQLLALVLLFSTLHLNAQNKFGSIDNWLTANVSALGGRTYLIVYHQGKIVYSKGVNELNAKQRLVQGVMARRQNNEKDYSDFNADSRLQIASCSKWLSAALVMTFVDEGKLKLTDTIGRFLTQLSNSGKGKITLGQCLSHLTAIKAPALAESLNQLRNNKKMDDAIDDIIKMPMEGEPGRVFRYSNVGLQLAGSVMEKVSGKSFEELFQQRLAKPLQLKNTSFGKAKIVLPAGGAVSSAADYTNFLVMILNKGTFNGKRILSEKSIAEMQVNRTTNDVKIAYSPAEAGSNKYGFGEWVLLDANGKTTAVSSPGLFGSYPLVDIEQKYTAYLMTYSLNNNGRQERYSALKKLITQAIR